MSAYFLSRVLAIAFAGAMCFGLFIAFAGIAYLIATPIVAVLRYYFPKLRPYQPPPLYLNFHKAEHVFLVGEKLPKPGVRASNRAVEQSGAYASDLPYIGEELETERFPVPPALTFLPAKPDPIPGLGPLVLPMGLHASRGPELPGADPLISIRRRALVRYLRSQHRTTPLTDHELLESFLSGIRLSKRFRNL